MAELHWWTAWRHDLALYRRLVGALVRAQMQYKVSFALMTLTGLVATGSELLAILILFGQFGTLAGWTAGEVALLYGLTSVAFGLHEMVVAGFDIFPNTIRRGEFDRVLVRPVSIFVQVLSADFQLRRIGRISQGVLALALAIAWTSIDWSPAKITYLPLALVSGALIYGALTLLGAVLCFWTIQSIEIINVLTYGGSELSSYPFEIYPGGLQRFFTFVIPLAFVSYYPGLFLLDRTDPLGAPSWLAFATPVAAVVLALAAWLAWRVGVRHYQSTGT
ncbi:MAG: ABC-2 family transporter protein [Chloroflexi bacterium]|nr:ABC-2 family transporter protein [Chloroflexota bacterium]